MSSDLPWDIQNISRDPRIEEAAINPHGLALMIGDCQINVVLDAPNGRTALWTRCHQLNFDQTEIGSKAAREFTKAHYEADNVIMGLHVEQNMLFIGRSIPGAQLSEVDVVDAADRLRRILPAAKQIVEKALAAEKPADPPGSGEPDNSVLIRA